MLRPIPEQWTNGLTKWGGRLLTGVKIAFLLGLTRVCPELPSEPVAR
jgi:hypothetical protein